MSQTTSRSAMRIVRRFRLRATIFSSSVYSEDRASVTGNYDVSTNSSDKLSAYRFKL